ncbi:MAG: hypothetical protein ACRDWV_09935 [Acidimicrobiales bacterium]
MTSVAFSRRAISQAAQRGGTAATRLVGWTDDHPILAAVGFGVLLAVITWPTASLFPQGGIDQSWQATLAMAAHRAFAGAGGGAAPAGLVAGGAAFGARLQFAYGPLGFLTYGAAWYPGTVVASTIWLALVRVAVMASLVWSLRRSFSLPAAAVLAWIAGITAFLIVTPEPLIGLGVIWCLALVRAELGDRASAALAGALGVLGGIGLLVKFSVGLVIVVLALIAALLRPAGPARTGPARTGPARTGPGSARRRLANAGVVLAGFVLTTVIGWLATANPLGDLPAWVSSSVQVTAGYSAGMGLELTSLPGGYWRALVVALVVLGVAALEIRRQQSTAAKFGIGLLAIAVLAAAFKEGFVRHNLHSLIYFGVAAMALAGLRAIGSRRKAALAGGLAVLALAGFATAGWLPRTNLSPVSGVQALAHQVAVVSSGSRTAATIKTARTAMQAAYNLDPTTLSLVDGQTTWVYPWEEAVAWAYPQIRYDPPPVFQNYQAYTPALDRADAKYLASAKAPRRILVQPELALDDKYPAFEPPATRVAMMCHYAQANATPAWQVLSLVAPRCGAPRVVRSVGTGWDQWVSVPTPPAGYAILASWAPLPRSLGGRIAGLVLRPPVTGVQVMAGQKRLTYRFTVATAGEEHLVVPPTTLGSTGAYVPADITRLRLTGGGLGPSNSGVRVTFSEVKVASPTNSGRYGTYSYHIYQSSSGAGPQAPNGLTG